MNWNNLSGGVCSSAMALMFPKVPNVIVNTGGNYPWAWRNVHKLRRMGIKVIVLSSFNAKKTGCWFCPKQEKPPSWVMGVKTEKEKAARAEERILPYDRYEEIQKQVRS